MKDLLSNSHIELNAAVGTFRIENRKKKHKIIATGYINKSNAMNGSNRSLCFKSIQFEN